MKLPPERCFHFPDGTSASSLDELRDKIESISYNTFYHHVDSSKNDFASWVRYVLKDPQLADELEKVNSIVETVELLNDYLQPNAIKKHFEQDDIQSKIEKQIGLVADNLPEPAPPTEPVPEIPAMTENELSTQTSTVEPVEPVHPTQLDPPDLAESAQPATVEKPARPQKSFHYQRRQGELNEIDGFHEDMTKLIVKDFIWGMLFGLILGFLLARTLGL